MQKQIGFFFSLCLLSLNAAMATPAYRDEHRSYVEYLPLQEFSDSAVSAAQAYTEVDWSRVSAWESDASLLEAFHWIRDLRFLKSGAFGLRRSSWLYPADGCWIRAELAGLNLADRSFPLISKIFIFGNLSVETPNAMAGKVTWWYHVAPAVRMGEKVVILDPAMEPTRPLFVDEWAQRMNSDPSTLQVAICSDRTYRPSSSCDEPVLQDRKEVEKAQARYLDYERQELELLKRNPDQELGEIPPWRSSAEKKFLLEWLGLSESI